MFINKNYILASSSSSRRYILKRAGFSFEQIKPMCDEEKIKKKINKKKLSASIIARKLSYEKSISVSKRKKYSNKLVIGCDTIIYLKNKVFDKARNMAEARKKLKILSGKKHRIVSALTICKNEKLIWQCSTTTVVRIRKLTDKEINTYLKKVGKEILRSVGCYQIEGLGANIIEDISGDFFNVMGLPLFKLLKYSHQKK